jgi:serine/threonine protein kinase
MVGTLNCIAPEIVLEQNHSYPVDVWSLGCIIYELMTGKKAFQGDSEKTLNKTIVTKNPDQIAGKYSNFLINLVSKMLEKNPEARITLSEIEQKLSLLQIQSIEVNYVEGTKVDFFPFRSYLDQFQHWIFISKDFDIFFLILMLNQKNQFLLF